MPLEKMDLNELRDLSAAIDALCRAGGDMPEGMVPEFDLTPGQPVSMTLNYALPLATFKGEADGPSIEDMARQFDRNLETFLRASMEAAEGLPEYKPNFCGAPSAIQAIPELKQPNPLVVDTVKVEPGTDAGGASPGTGADPAPSEHTPAPVDSAATNSRPPAWTDEEDAQLVEGVVSGVMRGMSRHHAAGLVARVLGRPLDGTVFRCKNKLRARIEDELQLRSPAPAPAEPVSEPAGIAPEAAAADILPIGDAPTDDLGIHLWNLPRKGDWHMGRDLILMEFSCLNWDAASIAGELGCSDREVKQRYDLLVKNRQFKRDAVLARLQQFMAAAGA